MVERRGEERREERRKGERREERRKGERREERRRGGEERGEDQQITSDQQILEIIRAAAKTTKNLVRLLL